MFLSRKQIALLHVAKGKLKLTEASFRSALVQIGGVASVKDLDQQGFEALIGFFEYLGFAPLVAKGHNYGNRLRESSTSLSRVASYSAVETSSMIIWTVF